MEFISVVKSYIRIKKEINDQNKNFSKKELIEFVDKYIVDNYDPNEWTWNLSLFNRNLLSTCFLKSEFNHMNNEIEKLSDNYKNAGKIREIQECMGELASKIEENGEEAPTPIWVCR